MAKNLCGKTRNVAKGEKPYEVWTNGSWTWNVLKKYQSDEAAAKNPYARAFCSVVTPICPKGELGDVYLSDISRSARLVEKNY